MAVSCRGNVVSALPVGAGKAFEAERLRASDPGEKAAWLGGEVAYRGDVAGLAAAEGDVERMLIGMGETPTERRRVCCGMVWIDFVVVSARSTTSQPTLKQPKNAGVSRHAAESGLEQATCMS